MYLCLTVSSRAKASKLSDARKAEGKPEGSKGNDPRNRLWKEVPVCGGVCQRRG